MLLPLSHVGGHLAGEEVFAQRREDVHDLGGLREPGLVLDAAGNDTDVAGHARPFLVAETKLHASREHPEDLLVRMAMGGRVRSRLHRPPHDHLLFAGDDATRDLVGHLFFGQALQRVIALHESHRCGLLAMPRRDGCLKLIRASTSVKDVYRRNAVVSPRLPCRDSRSASSPSRAATTTARLWRKSCGRRSSASTPCGWRS